MDTVNPLLVADDFCTLCELNFENRRDFTKVREADLRDLYRTDCALSALQECALVTMSDLQP